MPTTGDKVIDVSASGDATLVSAPNANQFIRVYHYHVTADRPVTVKFKSGSEVKDVVYSTQSSGGGICTPEYQGGIFDCNNGEALVINLSTTANVGGALKYTIKGGQPGNSV